MQRGEGVVGNAGLGIGNGRDEGGLAGIGHAEQTHIGQHLQFQLQAFPVAGPARRFAARRPVGGTLETQVAKTAVTPLGDQNLLTRHQQLIKHLAGFGVAQNGSDRHLEDDVVTLGAKHVRAHAVLALQPGHELLPGGETRVAHHGLPLIDRPAVFRLDRGEVGSGSAHLRHRRYSRYACHGS